MLKLIRNTSDDGGGLIEHVIDDDGVLTGEYCVALELDGELLVRVGPYRDRGSELIDRHLAKRSKK